MNPPSFVRWCFCFPWLAAISISAQGPATAPEIGGNRVLEFQIDAQPINRDAPSRVSYAPVIQRTSPSVVFVHSKRQAETPENLLPFLNDPIMRRFHGNLRQSPAPVRRGLGSGVIVSRDGYILTNRHVVADADEIQVSIGDSLRRHEAKVIGMDELADLAVLKIEAEGLQPAVFGDSEQLQVGDVVLAIGNPFGVGLSVSSGIVSAVGRGNLGIEQIEDFIQTDAAINTGNSGGALVDSAGRVVGINTAILTRTGGFAGVGFAIPINLARTVAEQLVNFGEVRRGFLGVSPQAITPELADEFGAQRGALIAEVIPGSAAERAGLQAGDIITAINGREVIDPRQLLLATSQLPPESRVVLDVTRNGRAQTLEATLDRRPQDALARGSSESPAGRREQDGVLDGVAVDDLTPDLRARLSIPERIAGAVVTQVDPTSEAAAQGLRSGDVILELDRQPVSTAREAIALSARIAGPKVLVRIWRGGQSRYLVVDESKQRAAG